MANEKFTEAEIFAALKRSEAGVMYKQIGREIGISIAAWKVKHGG